MQRYRCPRCGYAFYGKISKCPHCKVIFHFPGDPIPGEEKLEENKEEVQENIIDVPQEEAVVEETTNEEQVETVEEAEPVQELEKVEPAKEVEIDTNAPSYFDGRLIQMIGWGLLGGLVTLVTLGICYPLAYGWMAAWKTNHTVINGYRQKFIGVAGSLIPRWILWGFLTIITLTIFGWWAPIRLEKWRVERTILVKDEKRD